MDARWSDLWAAERRAATATVALGVVLFAFNAFVVSTALPRAVVEFGGTRWLAWATSLYIICAIVTGPSAAMVMQRVGARAMFMVAGAVFLVGTLLTAAAPGMGWLLAGRAMQGAAAGLIESGCYVLIPRLFPSHLIPRVFGIEAVVWAVAAFAAPALAGFLAEAVSWRVAMLTSVPMAVIFLMLVPKVVGGREVVEGAVPRLPIVSLLGVAAGMGLIVLSDGVGAFGLQLITVAAGFGLFVAVVRADGRWGERLVPRGAFSLRRKMGLGLWVALLLPLSETVEAVFLVYMLQFLWEFTPLQAGLSASVLALSWSVTQMLTAQLRGDRGWLVVAGAALMLVGASGDVRGVLAGLGSGDAGRAVGVGGGVWRILGRAEPGGDGGVGTGPRSGVGAVAGGVFGGLWYWGGGDGIAGQRLGLCHGEGACVAVGDAGFGGGVCRVGGGGGWHGGGDGAAVSRIPTSPCGGRVVRRRGCRAWNCLVR